MYDKTCMFEFQDGRCGAPASVARSAVIFGSAVTVYLCNEHHDGEPTEERTPSPDPWMDGFLAGRNASLSAVDSVIRDADRHGVDVIPVALNFAGAIREAVKAVDPVVNRPAVDPEAKRRADLLACTTSWACGMISAADSDEGDAEDALTECLDRVVDHGTQLPSDMVSRVYQLGYARARKAVSRFFDRFDTDTLVRIREAVLVRQKRAQAQVDAAIAARAAKHAPPKRVDADAIDG